ncbi:MAG: hypothetical protein PHV28_18665, partial [Kiritimatiellae bacterium]|nr:hypothetical protein [Kiritimatiellia bacterium]
RVRLGLRWNGCFHNRNLHPNLNRLPLAGFCRLTLVNGTGMRPSGGNIGEKKAVSARAGRIDIFVAPSTVWRHICPSRRFRKRKRWFFTEKRVFLQILRGWYTNCFCAVRNDIRPFTDEVG